MLQPDTLPLRAVIVLGLSAALAASACERRAPPAEHPAPGEGPAVAAPPSSDESPAQPAASPAKPPAQPAPADHPAQALLHAYPEQLCGARGNQVLFCDGTVMPFDDGEAGKRFEDKLERADLEDQLSQRYSRGRFVPAAPDHDPGRIRHLPFFKRLYGATADEVRAQLRAVPWPSADAPTVLRVTRVNGVDRALAAVAAEVARLPAAVRGIVEKPAGGFNYRAIHGTQRLSAHSFGIAVDVGVGHADYWRWAKLKPGETLRPRNRIPMEVVETFERHGFIWGGRWYHYDTMHFEYRPELLWQGERG